RGVDRGADLPRQRATTRVAQADEGRAGACGRGDAGERVVRVASEPVEEVLGVEDDLVHARAQEGYRVADHLEVLLQRDAQVVPHVQIPGLADDRDHRRLRAQQRLEVAVVGGPDPGPARRAEGRDAGMAQAQLAGGAEELLVPGIGAGPAALDV